MAVKFITAWQGRAAGDVESFDAGVETALIAGKLARDAAEDDNAGASDLQAQITALLGKLPTVAGNYADNAAAEAAGVAVGALYHTNGAVKIRTA